MEKIFEEANLTRYSRNEIRIEVDTIKGLLELREELKRKLSSVLVIHIPTGMSACVCSDKPQRILLKEALEILYTRVENAYKIEEDKLTSKIEDKTLEEWNNLIEEWHKGNAPVGLTLREFLGMNKETFEKFCKL